MDDGWIPLVLYRGGNSGPAERDQAERLDAVREAQGILENADAFGDGMNARPDRAESERMDRQQEVFGRSRGVLNPVFAGLAGERLVQHAADHDRDGRGGGHFRVRQAVSEFFEEFTVPDDDERPRLGVLGRRCGHRGFQELFDRLIRDRLVEERAYARARHDEL